MQQKYLLIYNPVFMHILFFIIYESAEIFYDLNAKVILTVINKFKCFSPSYLNVENFLIKLSVYEQC